MTGVNFIGTRIKLNVSNTAREHIWILLAPEKKQTHCCCW